MCTLGSADISPFSGSGKLSKLFVGNPQGYSTPFAMKMDSIKVGVQLGSVTKDIIVVNEINIQSPEITFDGGLSGNNLSKLQENLNSSSAASTSAPSNTVQTPSGPEAGKETHREGSRGSECQGPSEPHYSRTRQIHFRDRAHS